MPQLEILSWLQQITSTFLVLSFFYVFITLQFLPALTAVIKGRYKLNSLRQQICTLQLALSGGVGEDSLQNLQQYFGDFLLDAVTLVEDLVVVQEMTVLGTTTFFNAELLTVVEQTALIVNYSLLAVVDFDTNSNIINSQQLRYFSTGPTVTP